SSPSRRCNPRAWPSEPGPRTTLKSSARGWSASRPCTLLRHQVGEGRPRMPKAAGLGNGEAFVGASARGCEWVVVFCEHSNADLPERRASGVCPRLHPPAEESLRKAETQRRQASCFFRLQGQVPSSSTSRVMLR